MRLRKVRGCEEVIGASPYCIPDPERFRGKWNACFGQDAPLYLEIGMGKGKFLREAALLHPEIHYLGIELFASVLVRAVQKTAGEEIPNLRFLWLDAERLPEIFAPGEVDRIYLNFSDPWPKARHAKRRLTSSRFLDRYRSVLSPDGRLEFKTDNEDLFAFSLAEIPAAGWRVLACTDDLYRDEALLAGNIATEYEERFRAEGKPIRKLIAAPADRPLSGVIT